MTLEDEILKLKEEMAEIDVQHSLQLKKILEEKYDTNKVNRVSEKFLRNILGNG